MIEGNGLQYVECLAIPLHPLRNSSDYPFRYPNGVLQVTE